MSEALNPRIKREATQRCVARMLCAAFYRGKLDDRGKLDALHFDNSAVKEAMIKAAVEVDWIQWDSAAQIAIS